MNAGLFKRSLAFIIDGFIYLSITFWIFNFIAGPVYQRQFDDFDMHWNVYFEVTEMVEEDMEVHQARYEDNEITYAELLEIRAGIFNDYYEDEQYRESIDIALGYRDFTMFSSILIFILANYIGILVLKGQTLGRKLMKLRLSGEVNWFSLLLREVFWKYLFWLLTLGIGLMIDILMIFLSTNHTALRDRFSKTHVVEVLEDGTYPI